LIGAPCRTADFFQSDMEFLGRVANWIVNEARGINRVAYDVTSNRPAQSSGTKVAPDVILRRQSASVLLSWAAQTTLNRRSR
jgi:hypothetical protein